MKNVGLWAGLYALVGCFFPVLFYIAAPFILLYAVVVLGQTFIRLFIWTFRG